LITDIELAYVAGIIDGEGTICITKISSKWVKSQSGFDYYSHVGVGISNKDLCEWLKIKFGGCVTRQKRSAKFPNSKDIWMWQIRRSHTTPFLKAIEPYLKIKRLQAQNVIEYQERITPSNSKKLTSEDYALREAQYLLAKSLNS